MTTPEKMASNARKDMMTRVYFWRRFFRLPTNGSQSRRIPVLFDVLEVPELLAHDEQTGF